MKRMSVIFSLLTLILICACSKSTDDETTLNSVAERYVKLVLNVGTHDPIFVDAYYGPEEWKPKEKSTTLQQLISEADELLNVLKGIDQNRMDDLLKARVNFLTKQIVATKTYCEILNGKKMSFDEQSKNLYDAVSPKFELSYFDSLLSQLETILPGKENLYDRYNRLKAKFIIPEDKVDTVFNRAIEECRTRTKKFIELPANESFTSEYVTNQVWGAYNWYKGNNFSLIQINTDLPKYIDSPISLASHEGYPGHHVYNVLLENKLMKEKGWIEYCVYPLFSPQSFIAEGTANCGVDLIFPGDESEEFEIKVLFPLAGLDSKNYDLYVKASSIIGKLGYIQNNIARDLMDGNITDGEAVELMMKYNLSTRARAEKSLDFIRANGSYVITYNIGQDMVRDYINRHAGEDLNKMKEDFKGLLSRPATASDLLN